MTHLIYLQGIWKRAFREGLLVIDLGPEMVNQRQRLRMTLYKAVKLAKQGLDEDQELNAAAQAMEIVDGNGPGKLVVRKIADSPLIKAMEQTLGVSYE